MSRDPMLGPDAKANLKIIGRSGEHLLTLINAVLDMSKIESGRAELNPVTFSLTRLLHDLAAMFRLRTAAKALSFEMLIDGESVPYVVADEGKIRQMLINLVGNAIKFTRRGYVKLHVHLRQQSTQSLWLSCQVEDTGVGMTEEDQEKLFEPFTQAKGEMNVQEGTGLGLSISRQFARLMGGDLTVVSSPGSGSLFQFEIPVERGNAAAALKRTDSRRVIGLRAGTSAPRVLIADDLPENRDWLMKLLTAIGFSVQGADNGETAIQNWRQWQPQMILMDVHMPIVDGLEATRRIKADPRGNATAIVVLTASALEEDRRAVAASGADDFLSKPCRENELLEKMRALLHIDYDYEESDETEALTPLSPPEFGPLPPGLEEALRNAISDGNKKLLDKLIVQVREQEAAAFANALQGLADRYDYDALTNLLADSATKGAAP
jgi:CheY-like chemotaxis protein